MTVSLLPTAVLAWLGLVQGCRWGLLGLLPASVLLVVLAGAHLATPGDFRDPGPGRPLAWGDLAAGTAVVNVVVVLMFVVVLTVLVRRRRTGP